MPRSFQLALTLTIFALAATVSIAQIGGNNNPYSPSPSSKTGNRTPVTAVDNVPDTRTIAFVAQPSPTMNSMERVEAPTTAAAAAGKPANDLLPATDLYRVGVGDVLFIELRNSPTASGYITVRPDGTIDYPLAGDHVAAAGRTTDEIRDTLTAGIKLFADALVEVKVREYSSHKVTVSGMVASGGEFSLQREAIPMFVIRAQAGVDAKAAMVVITRAEAATSETHDLKAPATDNILVYPGDRIEFTSEAARALYYFIAGEVTAGGQRAYSPGLTLFQAIVASGGQKAKKATIRRKNEKGTLDAADYDVRSIRGGKSPDPALSAGDMIEVVN